LIRHSLIPLLYQNMWILHNSNKAQCICISCIPPCLSYNPDKAVILRNGAITSQYVSWKQGNKIAEEVYRTQLLQFDSQVVHLDDWSSFQSRPNFDVRAKWKWRPRPPRTSRISPRLSYNPDRAVILQNGKTMLEIMWDDIRQLGWRWRYAGRHCCNEMVMCILTT
jgi:hypothetical protein